MPGTRAVIRLINLRRFFVKCRSLFKQCLKIYKKSVISERHRHRFEFNNQYRDLFEKNGLKATGVNEERNLVEILENTKHPWFIGVQFHPEFKSKPLSPHPLFAEFIRAAGKKSK